MKEVVFIGCPAALIVLGLLVKIARSIDNRGGRW